MQELKNKSMFHYLVRPVMRKLGLVIVYLVFTLATTFAVVVICVYAFDLQDKANRNLGNFLPLPEALVGSTIIFSNEINARVEAFEKISQTHSIDRNFIRDTAIKNAIVEHELKKRKISINKDELANYYTYVLASINLEPRAAAKELKETFGWSEKDFKRYIVLPELESSKLAVELNDEHKNSDAYRKIEKARAELLDGRDFAQVVKDYSEDETSLLIAGDLGFKEITSFDPWLARAVGNLKADEISDIVISPEGYEIIKVVARDDSANPVKFQLRHILVRGQDINQYLESAKANYKIFIFSKG